MRMRGRDHADALACRWFIPRSPSTPPGSASGGSSTRAATRRAECLPLHTPDPHSAPGGYGD
jgi:hypothetical protein